jgi:hypothetical protein
VTAPAAAVLGLHIEAVAGRCQVDAHARSYRPAPNIGRVSTADGYAVGGGVVVARAIIVQRAHDLRRAPRLLDTDIASDIRHEEAGIVPRAVGGTAGGQDRKERAETCDHAGGRRRIEVLYRPAIDRTVFEAEARGPAAAELGGVGECKDAEAAEILIGKIGLQAVAGGVEEIESRDGLAGREASVLDEGASEVDIVVAVWRNSRRRRSASGWNCGPGKAECRGVVAAVLPTGEEISAERSVLGLLARIE